jgi:asparagine synthase (glutamine-hydrolysing)
MCGIWGYIAIKNKINVQTLFDAFNTVRDRGPDRSDFKLINELSKIYLGFHRLAIMDRSTYGDQPFTLEHNSKESGNDISVYAMCNGEIYNYHQIVETEHLSSVLKGKSDCEIIPHMYIKYGFVEMLNKLRSESAICIVEINRSKNKITLMLSRDQLGIRPLFVGIDNNGIVFSSILKGVVGIVDHKSVRQLGRAEYLSLIIDLNTDVPVISHTFSTHYYDLNIDVNEKFLIYCENEDTFIDLNKNLNASIQKFIPQCVFDEINKKFTEAVEIRLESDRPIGALLSGGLDSSLVVSIAAACLKKQNKRLKTFSIGIPGSTDKAFAEMVSKHCDTDHTHVEFTESEFLNVIEDVVIATETYDITTIRASVGQYLISKWINENTNIRVLLNGDGSDELTSGYMYFHNAPDAYESHRENIRLLEEIRFYDVQRVDKCISKNGIEARVPFLDHKFVELYLSIPPEFRVPLQEGGSGRKIEKWLLRKSFDKIQNKSEISYLPSEVLWRKKEAFSDGVSSQKRSWYQVIQESLEKKYTQSDLAKDDVTYHIAPHTFEALHYRLIFNKHFHPKLAHIIPHYWLPKWSGDIKEPSARVLSIY